MLLKEPMKYRGIVIAIICLGVLSACEKSATDIEGATRTIQLHECTPLPGSSDSRLCFESVVSDSRCPANANCIWGGTAIARFSIAKHDARIHVLTLATPLPVTYGRDTVVAGYKIEFVNLHPYPSLGAPPVPASEIKAEVKITKL
jgi:hypothetical protein